MSESLDPRGDELARSVFATLAGVDAETLYVLAAAFELAGKPLALFHLPIFYLATGVERGEEEAGLLALLTMRGALKEAALAEGLLERLEDAREPLWAAVRDSVQEIADRPATMTRS